MLWSSPWKMSHLLESWITGEGIKPLPLEPHDREVLCLDVQGSQLATGSCDHAVHLYDLNTKRLKRKLYTKQYGHHEWYPSLDCNLDYYLIQGNMCCTCLRWKTSIWRHGFCTLSLGTIVCKMYRLNGSYVWIQFSFSLWVFISLRAGNPYLQSLQTIRVQLQSLRHMITH